MSICNKFTFVTKTDANEKEVLSSYTMWCKSKKVLTNGFPEVFQSEFYQKLQLYGIQRFWMRTWVERFQSTRTIGESDPEINNCWASLLILCLDQLWPNLDQLSPCDLELLNSINVLTDRIKGARLNAYSLATHCNSPNRVEGFIDLFEENSANEPLTQWVRTHFLKDKK